MFILSNQAGYVFSGNGRFQMRTFSVTFEVESHVWNCHLIRIDVDLNVRVFIAQLWNKVVVIIVGAARKAINVRRRFVVLQVDRRHLIQERRSLLEPPLCLRQIETPTHLVPNAS